MSYPPPSGYYNGSAHQAQNYMSARNSSEPSRSYAQQPSATSDTQRPRYGGSGYDWTRQEQHTAQKPAEPSHGRMDNWRGSEPVSYDYSRQNGYYAQSNTAAADGSAYAATSRDPFGHTTQALSSLAYASGLKPAVPRQDASQNTMVNQSGYMSSPVVNTASTRMDSRNAMSSNRYSLQPPASYQAQEERPSSSSGNTNLAVSAAAALAGAVAVQHANAPSQYHSARVASPEVRANGFPNRNTAEPPERSTPVNRKSQQVRDNVSQPQAVSASAEPKHSPNQTRRLPAVNDTTQQPASINNLVHENYEAQQPAYGSIEARDNMPNFIDPSQVFNPYHREHELKKMQAEAEAMRQVEEVRHAEETRKAEEARKIEEARQAKAAQKLQQAQQAQADQEAEKARRAEAARATKTKRKQTPASRTNANEERSEAPFMNPGSAQSSAIAAAPEEEAMAAEMRSFMERMKEFRSKDPGTFLKLWNEMRGKDNTSAPNTTSKQLPATQRSSTDMQDLSVGLNVVPPQTAATPKSTPHVLPAGSTAGESPLPPPNGCKVVVENNPENLPDIGRYPAMRRIRNSYVKKTPQSSETTPAPYQPPSGSNHAPTMTSLQSALLPPAPSISLSTIPSRPFPEAWPEPRRRAVATAAVDLLKSTPANANNPIIAQDIASLLEQNPSYLDLCSALEQRGLQFSRNLFAKELLGKVPELSSANNHENAGGPPEVGPSQGASIAAQVNGAASNVGPATPLTGPIQYKKIDGSRANDQRRKAPSSSSNALQVGIKEAAARKRDFSDFVDLTALDDNEDYVLPVEKPNIRMGREHSDPSLRIPADTGNMKDERTISGYGAAVNSVNFPTMTSNVKSLRFDTQVAIYNAQQIFGPSPLFTGLNTSARMPTASNSKMILAKKTDKNMAIGRSYFDPRTIARDVLISSGRHPTERPLNWHLAGMLHSHTQLDSDLGTLDWDAIDPGGPAPPDVELEEIVAERPKTKQKRKSRKMLDIETSTTAQQASLPRKHKPSAPHSSAPPAHDTDRSSSLHVKPRKLNQTRDFPSAAAPNNPSLVTPRKFSVSIDLSSNRPVRQASRSVSRSVEGSQKPVNSVSSEPGKKRVGRPPGAKNRHPSVANLKKQAKSLWINLPSSSPAPVPAPATQSAIAPAPATKMAEQPPEPVHHEFRCRWVQCKVTLHNLATLRRHVPKNHAPKPDDEEQRYSCWWKKCSLLSADAEGTINPSKYFDDEESWLAHIDEEHMAAVGRSFGDGPATSHMDPQRVQKDREKYLSDDSGRQATPSINADGGLNLPKDTLELTRSYPQGPRNDKEKAEVTAQNAWLRAHGHKSTEQRERADQILRAMTARKEKIGAGIDRGGCTLINEKRRAGFIQNPGIARIIDAEY